jgi:SAM-dependent methyltransferase
MLREAFTGWLGDRTIARVLGPLDSVAAAAARHETTNVFPSLIRRLRRTHADLSTLRVLDFGCGTHTPLARLLAPYVREVVGVDVEPGVEDGLAAALLTHELTPRAIAYAAREHLIATRKVHHLHAHGAPEGDIARVVYDGGHLPFEDARFDAIVSNSVLQELPLPLSRFSREMARVLRPGGFVDIEWHNFYSLEGHYLDASQRSGRLPWFHLQGGPYDPRLNRVLPHDVASAFSQGFEEITLHAHDRQHRLQDIDDGYEAEGEALLTAAIERAVDLPRSLLTTRGFVLFARRVTT